MGCGASKAPEADPLDPAAGKRNKSSSVVSVNQKAAAALDAKAAEQSEHKRSESNPFLEKQPGVDEHKRPASARTKVERSEEKEEAEEAKVEEFTTPVAPNRKVSTVEEKEQDEEQEEGGEKATAADEKDSHRDKSAGRQLIPASTPVTPAAKNAAGAAPSSPGRPAPLARSNSFTDIVLQQPPSYNLSDPLTLTSGMSKCFLHYAHKKFDASHSQAAADTTAGGDDDDEDKLDKKAVAQLTHDCAVTFMLGLKREMAKVKEINRKKEEEYQRRRCLPLRTAMAMVLRWPTRMT